MMRPNLAQDTPPSAISVGGVSYDVDTDYRVWLDVLRDMRLLKTQTQSMDDFNENAERILDIETRVFGQRIPHPANDVLSAIADFAKGYPSAPTGEGKAHAPTYSFDWDINYILLAIHVQYGIDLSAQAGNKLHWWMFLLYFNALCGDHYILRLMEIRGYDGKDKDLRQQAYRFALPKDEAEQAEDAAILDIFNKISPE